MLQGITFFLVAFCAQEDKDARIRRAIDWYSDTDAEIREVGRKELLAMGPEAIPYLEKLLELRGAMDIYRLLREVDKAQSSAESKWLHVELPNEEELLREQPRPTSAEAERYVRVKLAEAAAAAKKGNYQRGYDLANALLVLEPRSAHAEEIRRVRRYCDAWITQTSLVRTRVASSARAGIWPARQEFMLRMENVWKQGLKVLYETGSPQKPATPFVVVEITCTLLALRGSSATITRSLEIPIEAEIPIALGAQWEKPFTVDLAVDVPEDELSLRLYTLGAWTQPTKIDFGLGTTQRRILFEPLQFIALPKRFSFLLEDPLAWLRKTMATGQTYEVFLAAMLVGDADKPEAIDLLVQAMEGASNVALQADIAHILTQVTAQQLGMDPKKWREYADTLSQKRREAPSKQSSKK